MSLHFEGKSCPVCHAYLFEDDDIVYCPVCGAPHHRDCYNSIGHCGLEHLHGTPNEYRRPDLEEQDAPPRELPVQIEKTGAPNLAGSGFGLPAFDLLGGVEPDVDLGDGVTAEEARHFVSANTQRYIPKFAILNGQNKLSWNWMAFMFPCGWFLSRKMYKNGIVIGALWIAASLLSLPVTIASRSGPVTQATTYTELFSNLIDTLSKTDPAIMVMSVLSFVFLLILRVFSGLFGDYFYKNHAISRISEIKKESENIDEDLRKKGGLNFIAFMIGIMAVNYYIPMILEMFF